MLIRTNPDIHEICNRKNRDKKYKTYERDIYMEEKRKNWKRLLIQR